MWRRGSSSPLWHALFAVAGATAGMRHIHSIGRYFPLLPAVSLAPDRSGQSPRKQQESGGKKTELGRRAANSKEDAS